MAKDTFSRALCFAGGVITTVACTRYLANRGKKAGIGEMEYEEQERSRLEAEVRSLKAQLCAKDEIISEQVEILLDRSTSSHEDTLHAIILGVQAIANMTESLSGKIEKAKEVWAKVAACSSATSVDPGKSYFDGISKAKQLGMDIEPFIKKWKDWMLMTDDPDMLLNMIDRREAASIGIDDEPFKEHWRSLILSSRTPSRVHTAIPQAIAMGVDEQLLKNHWKELVLQEAVAWGDIEGVYSAIPQAVEIGIDDNPFKERWRALVLHCRTPSRVHTAIPQAIAMDVDEQPLKDYWKELVVREVAEWGDIEAVYSAIPQAVEMGIDTEPIKSVWQKRLIDAKNDSLIGSWCKTMMHWIPRCVEIGVDADVLKEHLQMGILECEDPDDLVSLMPELWETCATPTGKILMSQASLDDANLVMSFHFFSGKIALPPTGLRSDTTVAWLENHIKRQMGWESAQAIDSLSQCRVPGQEVLKESSDFVIKEVGLGDACLRRIWMKLISLDMFHAERRSSLTAFLSHRAELRKNGIDLIGIEPFRIWVCSAISSQEIPVSDLSLLTELVADVPSWASALAAKSKVMEASAHAAQLLLFKPSVATWMMSPEAVGRCLRKRPARGKEYQITLARTWPDQSRLGIEVDHQHGSTLLIDDITFGHVHDWNQRNPSCAVRIGDRIIEVNGIRDDILRMVEECKKITTLNISLVAS